MSVPSYLIGNSSGSILFVGPIASPTSLVATPAGKQIVNLTWTVNSTSETGIRVERSLDANTWATIIDLPPSTAAYSDQSLTPGTLYYYRVTALGSLLNSLPSNTASATTDPTVPVVTGITLADLPNNSVFQRDIGGVSKFVPLAGTYTGGAPGTVEAQILSGATVIKDWTTLTGGSIGAGVWTGAITTPQGGPYTAKIRAGDSHGIIATGTNQWNVGIVIGGCGQSNLVGTFLKFAAPIPAAVSGTYYYGIPFFDGFAGSGWTTVPATNGLRTMLNSLRALTGLPVAAILGAVGGQNIQALSKGAGTNIYENFLAAVLAGPGTVEAIVWDQGEGNTNGSTPSTEPQYKVLFDTLHGQYASDLGLTKAQIPMFIGTLGTTNIAAVTPGDTTTDVTWATIRSALANCAVEQAGVIVSHSNDNSPRGSDPYHYTPLAHESIGRWFAQSIANHLGFVSTGNPAWEITGGAVIDGTHTTVALTHGMGTDFTPTTGITGFEVSGDGGGTWQTPSSAVRTNATTITLTHESINTSNLRQVRYQYGMRADLSAVANLVLDNSALANPLVYTHPVLSPTPLFIQPAVTYLQSNSYTGTGTTRTLVAQSVGAAGAARLLVFAVASAGTASFEHATAVSCTFDVGGSASATLVEGVTTTSRPDVSLWQTLVPSGASTVDFSITFSASPQAGAVSCWTFPTALLTSTTKVGSAQATSAAGTPTTLTATLVSAAHGIIIMAGIGFGSTSAANQSGGDGWVERRDSVISGGRIVNADASDVSGSNNPVLAFGTTSLGGSMVCACWR